MVASSTEGRVIVVVGATGAQGGSVIDHLLLSDKPYQLKALTRDASKPASKALEKKGLSVLSGDVDKSEDLDAAFKGADIVFGVTNFWAHYSVDKEIADGKRIVDAAKKAGVKLLVWSGLEPVKEISKGKYVGVGHFDSKAAVSQYARASGVPTAVVEAGCYMSNFTTMMGPRKQPDGSLVFALPVAPSTKFALLNTVPDYGAFVREAIESPAFGAGSEVLACSDEISLEQMVAEFSKVTGAKASYYQLTDEDFLKAVPQGGEELLDMLQWFQEFGYYGGKPVAPSREHLATPVTPWAEFVRAAEWDVLK